MIRPFQAHLFTHLSFMLGQMHQLTKNADADNGPSPASVEALRTASSESMETVSYLGMKLTAIQLEEMAPILDKAVHDAITHRDVSGWSYANRAVFDAAKRLKQELQTKKFFSMPDPDAELYDAESPFGLEVAAAFQKAKPDIAECAKCLACGRWTASVFHAMRVLEHGLHKACDNTKVQWPKPWPLELEQWQTIIEQLALRIGKLQELPKGNYKNEVLQAYSQAATEFRYFKDAWRNHVSHSRESYENSDAKRVFNSVRNFMQDTATLPALP